MAFARGFAQLFGAALALLAMSFLGVWLVLSGLGEVFGREMEPLSWAEGKCADEGYDSDDSQYEACLTSKQGQSFWEPGIPEIAGGAVLLSVTTASAVTAAVVMARKERAINAEVT